MLFSSSVTITFVNIKLTGIAEIAVRKESKILNFLDAVLDFVIEFVNRFTFFNKE